MGQPLVDLLKNRLFQGIEVPPPLLTIFPPVLSLFTVVTGPRRSLGLKLSDTRVYEPCGAASRGLVEEPPLSGH